MNGLGGAVATWNSSANFVNCTFADNEATFEGGGIWFSGENTDTITNCIFWGNFVGSSMNEEDQIFLYEDPTPPDVTYTCIQGCDDFCAVSGDRNIGNNPIFCGEYRLGENSPCIDEGDNESVVWEDDLGVDVDDDGDLEETVADRDLNVRIVDGGSGAVVDMGAFERGPCPEADFNGDLHRG